MLRQKCCGRNVAAEISAAYFDHASRRGPIVRHTIRLEGDTSMCRYCVSGMALALFTCVTFAADDAASAVVATVKTVDKGTKTVVVKSKDGAEHTFHFVGRTI